ncbi:MAG: DNA-directed RNA polymerase subunit beta [Omnitrophica bacterium RIFCSPLOWO2_12_FULL_44_17]|uniref:DNA-directed RNA polymerase subunit beta n=1 Tax=Candidatus Danuiimicrobium aquiferis TaxID=1801832 RepID=A0A1G1KU09_9BACT|nr:MAG: DNA-directed RNA polymerase subunit beta [Omnitrophica bacterium RIFCSPHIGHO2_12_FULL_44_12]OGW96418.1 MAG: DNA-directed RNA polymerase subunit beta [Omnitrophica bacterium RIFCSPLOWO2_12_FULL_44_17]OGX01983.1 MAG: DNA-directed RNA polymerase subunit beta [Omnitrophica bacterium RIFCSPLOWO2_02_FULL_44_11]
MEIPNLVEIQIKSYQQFLQSDRPKRRRKRQGLEAVMQESFPIESFDGSCRLEYSGYNLGKPKYSVSECHKRGMTYAAPLKVKLRLVRKGIAKEQEVYIGELPLMTETGTFIINGAERVVVSQLHRSPGVSLEESTHPSGKRIFSVRIIPYRGAWVEFEGDVNDVLYAYIDRRRKILATTLLRALGFSTSYDILKTLYPLEKVKDFGSASFKKLEGAILAKDIADPETKEIIGQSGIKLTKEVLKTLDDHKISAIEVVRPAGEDYSLVNTLERDPYHNKEEAQIAIYRRIRPGDPPTAQSAADLIDKLFFDAQRYDLGTVGRFMLNRKLDIDVALDQTTLRAEDVLRVVQALLKLRSGEMKVDDIDHLGNRRVRSVGELLQNQFRVGLARMKRSALERMAIYDLDAAMPHNLINPKLISASIKDFFGRSQLSQFMDQTNPLSELTHKRRLSALGPGGLSRERAGFEVRDVHPSHYGRVCPIETPEGPNIGLIASLSTFAQVNDVGFLESPYRKVVNGRATDKIEYLTADQEDKYVIAQANNKVDKHGHFLDEQVSTRFRGDFPMKDPKDVDYMDVSPRQLVSIAAALIPFLEHDDANRALMGSNMQRQAVPLLVTDAPIVGTGMERKTALDSGSTLVSKTRGTVKAVSSHEVVVDDLVYKLKKFERSNAGTCVNQRPLVNVGDKVKRGDVIADGAGTERGDLALGKNVLVAFLPWCGYNFEDAIIVSEKLLMEDGYTSLHIEEFEIEARDTKLGNEEITRDIPNVSEESLKDLDAEGIVRIGAEVKPGDILVGKITPKSETELSPEEKLLRAIFGEKAGDVRDASLYVPPGIEGIVVDVKVFQRKELKAKTREEKRDELKEIEHIKEQYQTRIDVLRAERFSKISTMLLGKKLSEDLVDDVLGEVLIRAGRVVEKKDLKKLERCDWESIRIDDEPELEESTRKIARVWSDEIDELVEERAREIDRVKKGDELPPGVIKKVVAYVCSKRKISVGDKMAGRHGNKGVIAKILPQEDMPFLSDGTPVEIVLNPLGVPSRMNVGQILETHLGWAGKVLGLHFETPVFSGSTEGEIKEMLKKAGLPEDGKTTLRDGRTGKSFDNKITVGYIYMMKLAHLVDDKIHARAIGPYSLVTQQPLGGKAQFGGQRFGEMEVWALEAYGAAFTLQELLTVKSDDVVGRTRVYEAIVKGEPALHSGTPESFNVLVKELQSLGLDVITEKKVRSIPLAEISLSKKEDRKEKAKAELGII